MQVWAYLLVVFYEAGGLHSESPLSLCVGAQGRIQAHLMFSFFGVFPSEMPQQENRTWIRKCLLCKSGRLQILSYSHGRWPVSDGSIGYVWVPGSLVIRFVSTNHRRVP